MALVVAHRGASSDRPPGNTLEAFRTAVALAADGVELDVRLTADRLPAVHHDAALPDGRPVAEVAAADLPVWVPLLDAALDACAGLWVDVEVKADGPEAGHEALVGLVVDELRRRGAPERFLVTSFAWPLVDRVRALAPELPTGLLLFDPASGVEAVDTAAAGGHRAVNPWDPLVDAALVGHADRLGVELYPWTVDDPTRIAELGALGVTGIITNRPDVALTALGRGSRSRGG